MALKYIFEDDEPLRVKNAKDADPQRLGEALAEIAERNAGIVTPALVEEAARKRNHPWHRHLEWDDAKAAQAHRFDQVRALIRVIRLDGGSREAPKRAYYSINSKEGVAYRPLAAIQNSVDFQVALLNQAKRDVEAFRNRYSEISEVCDLADEMIRRIDARRDKLESGVPKST